MSWGNSHQYLAFGAFRSLSLWWNSCECVWENLLQFLTLAVMYVSFKVDLWGAPFFKQTDCDSSPPYCFSTHLHFAWVMWFWEWLFPPVHQSVCGAFCSCSSTECPGQSQKSKEFYLLIFMLPILCPENRTLVVVMAIEHLAQISGTALLYLESNWHSLFWPFFLFLSQKALFFHNRYAPDSCLKIAWVEMNIFKYLTTQWSEKGIASNKSLVSFMLQVLLRGPMLMNPSAKTQPLNSAALTAGINNRSLNLKQQDAMDEMLQFNQFPCSWLF